MNTYSWLNRITPDLKYVFCVNPVADTGGLQWFQLKPPLKIARAPNLLTSRRVGDKIATCVIEGFFTGENLHSLAFEITIMMLYSRL